jgi:hypothetical protein
MCHTLHTVAVIYNLRVKMVSALFTEILEDHQSQSQSSMLKSRCKTKGQEFDCNVDSMSVAKLCCNSVALSECFCYDVCKR